MEFSSLLFLLPKPWSLEGLRHTLRELFGPPGAFAGWDRVESLPAPVRGETGRLPEQVGVMYGTEESVVQLVAVTGNSPSPVRIGDFELVRSDSRVFRYESTRALPADFQYYLMVTL